MSYLDHLKAGRLGPVAALELAYGRLKQAPPGDPQEQAWHSLVLACAAIVARANTEQRETAR